MGIPKYYFAEEFRAFEGELLRLGARPVTFGAGEYLSRPGEDMNTCYYLQKGFINLAALDEEGGEYTLMFFGPGAIHPCVCGEYGFTLEKQLINRATQEVEALALPAKALEQLVRENGEFALTAIRHHCALENSLMTQRLFSEGLNSWYKVCNFLYLWNLNRGGTDPKSFLSQEEVAAIVGLSRVQVARVFARMRQEGLITTGRHWFQVMDMDRLRERCADLVEE